MIDKLKPCHSPYFECTPGHCTHPGYYDARHEEIPVPKTKSKPPETVPCKWCNMPTRMTSTKLCDRCWRLETRIRRDPELARRMLEELTK